ncbi:MAG: hypothetical protein R3A52_29570 [Polyangiales bacterium]
MEPPRLPVTTDDVRRECGFALRSAPRRALWDRARPTTREGWAALGREVFERYPCAPRSSAERACATPSSSPARACGLGLTGAWPGGRRQSTGDPADFTCALCHSDPSDRGVVYGRARRDFDYGRLRLAFHRDTGVPVDPGLARRMETARAAPT